MLHVTCYTQSSVVCKATAVVYVVRASLRSTDTVADSQTDRRAQHLKIQSTLRIGGTEQQLEAFVKSVGV